MSTVISKEKQGALLELDAEQFRAHFDREPFKMRHRLCAHPLLQLPRLVELARGYPESILYFRGDLDINQVDAYAPPGASGRKRTFIERELERPPLSAVETVAAIESCNAWLQLRDVGRDPQYAGLLRQLIDEFRPCAEAVAPGLSAPRADIFVSSPGALTPYHLDEEHNFLLQVRGSKDLSIADGFDPRALSPERLRAYFRGDGELVRHTQHLEQYSRHVHLAAGEGVHIPPCHPHWVRNGSEVSISLGILWFSDVTARRRHLHRVNRWIERLGVQPDPPGMHPRLDGIKALPLTCKRKLRRWLHGPGGNT